MLSLSIDPRLFTPFPDLLVAGLVVDRIDRAAARLTTGDVDALWKAARESIGARGVRPESVSSVTEIADWRRAFAASGRKPATCRSSVEALLRRVLKHGSLTTPLPVVSAYCALSVIHLAALGGYDRDHLPAGEVMVRYARAATDRFSPLGGRAEDMPLTSDIVVYACADAVLCWSFNHRDSLDTSLRPGTTRAAFFSEAVSVRQQPGVRAALGHLREWLSSHGAVAGPVVAASRDAPTAAIEERWTPPSRM